MSLIRWFFVFFSTPEWAGRLRTRQAWIQFNIDSLTAFLAVRDEILRGELRVSRRIWRELHILIRVFTWSLAHSTRQERRKNGCAYIVPP